MAKLAYIAHLHPLSFLNSETQNVYRQKKKEKNILIILIPGPLFDSHFLLFLY